MKEIPRCASEEAQRDFFERVSERAELAMQSRGPRSLHLQLAGTTIRLDFAGPAMVQATTTALQHRLIARPSAPVDAVFKVWDSVTTGIENVRPPWKNTDYSHRGDIWGFNSKRYLSSFHWGEHALNLFDTKTNTGIYWTQNAAHIPFWTRAAPFRSLFHWWTQHQGLQMMHGAAVGNADGALLITGRSGIGKSSTALTCLLSDMLFLGDDLLVVEHDPCPRVHCLYSTAKINWDQLRHFPGLENHLLPGTSREDNKACIALYPTFKPRLAQSLPLSLLVTPRFHKHAGTKLAPVTGELLQGAAALTTVSLLPHGGQQTYRFVRDLVRKVPVATLSLGQDRASIPKSIAGFLRPPIKDLQDTSETRPRSDNLPLITVIIPVFNGSQFLPEAVKCVTAQDYPSLEVIIVDDGSSDDIESAIRSLPVQVRFLRQANRGPGAARNMGIKNADGEFVAFLDVDDLWPDETLPTLSRYLLDHPHLDVVRGRAQLMLVDEAKGRCQDIGSPLESFTDYISAGLYRRSAFATVGLFDQTRYFGEDSDWFERFRAAGSNMHTLDLVTLFVRRHGANMTEDKNPAVLHKIRTIKNHLDDKRAKQ
jgi:hypothetical protein